jgi:tetratricopeptide (TPR) repeat protein
MRTALLLLALAGVAAADPALTPKAEPPLPPKVKEIAHGLFEEAAAAAAAGRLDVAIGKYHELDRLAPHPHISFNLAQLYERQDNLVRAIEHYDKYLAAVEPGERAPAAAHVDELRRRPGHVDLQARTRFATVGLWYVDGALVARGAATIDVPPGPHRIDAITELGFHGNRLDVRPGTYDGNRLAADFDERRDGNLIVSSTATDRWGWFYAIDGSDRDDRLGKGVHRNGRYAIDPGTHAIVVRDQICDYRATFEIAANQLTYVYIDRSGFDEKALLKHMVHDSPACGTIRVVRAVVHFDAPLPPHPYRGKP